MIAVLQRKLVDLIRGEEGVALVITLALFMLLYVSVAGVFVIGQVTKDKIALQNAVDAAAYSAAVVEADVLSRMATVNRAMAWTYKSMVCRQMDYVTKKWLAVTEGRYEACYSEAKTIGPNPSEQASVADVPGQRVSLQSTAVGLLEVKSKLAGTPDLETMQAEILVDGVRLGLMGAALDAMATQVSVAALDETVGNILEANLPGRIGDRSVYKLNVRDATDWMLDLTAVGSAYVGTEGERRFLDFAGLDGSEFNDNWFPCAEPLDTIRRSYTTSSSKLVSRWVWYDELGNSHDESVDALSLRDTFFDGARARPKVLAREYFTDAAGAISVAVAMANQNPWEMCIERLGTKAGLYEVFDPADAAQWTWAVASAQAAYRPFGVDDTSLAPRPRDYSLEYDERENLRTDDWDAVFVPVRLALRDKGLGGFLAGDSWANVTVTPDDSVPTYDPTKVAALPRMHNNVGTLNQLDIGELINLIYH